MKKSTRTFTAVIHASDGGGAYIEIPFDVEKEYGARGRVPVKATFDGLPYRGSIFPYGGVHMLLVLKSIRQKLGKDGGDKVRATVELDAKPRVVKIPDDLKKALGKNKTAKTIFDKLSYTHQREFVTWIEEAKREETRARRIEKMMAMLKEGKRER